MTIRQKLERLKTIQNEADAIREELKISPPKAVRYFAPLYPLNDQLVVVEADGVGGATTSVVEGNYPFDFVTHREKQFATEQLAINAAIEMVEEHATLTGVLG